MKKRETEREGEIEENPTRATLELHISAYIPINLSTATSTLLPPRPSMEKNKNPHKIKPPKRYSSKHAKKSAKGREGREDNMAHPEGGRACRQAGRHHSSSHTPHAETNPHLNVGYYLKNVSRQVVPGEPRAL